MEKKNDIVMRYQIADYLNTGGQVEKYSFMGVGFNTLDENPSAQSDGKTYISDRAQTNSIKSYQPQFPFDTDLMKSEEAVMALYEVGRNQRTGSEAELDYIRVEIFKKIEGKENTFAARKFRVSVEVSSIAGAGGEAIKVTGNLNNVGDFVDGEFDTTTLTFTAAVDAGKGELGVLSVLSEDGAGVGTTKITILPVLTVGNSYKYKTAASAVLPTMGQICSTGWTAWTQGDITAAAGHKIAVAEVNSDNKAVKAGIATVVVKG